MLWIFIVAAIAVLVWVLGQAPAMNELPDPQALARLFRLLISRGVFKAGISGTLTVCVREEPRRCLVFTKTSNPESGIGVAAALSRVPWAEPYYDKFRAELDRRGIPYQEIDTKTLPTLRFELGRDLGGAYVVAKIFFQDVLGVNLHRDCVAFFRDVVLRNTPSLTGVDAPDEGWG